MFAQLLCTRKLSSNRCYSVLPSSCRACHQSTIPLVRCRPCGISADQPKCSFQDPLPSKLPVQFYPCPESRHPPLGDFAVTLGSVRLFVHQRILAVDVSAAWVCFPSPELLIFPLLISVIDRCCYLVAQMRPGIRL